MKNSIIIVLGNWMEKSGCLNQETSSRLDFAIDHFKKNNSRLIITCGWDYYGEYQVAIAEAMKSYIIKKSSIAENFIIAEPNSRDTVGDAIFTKKNIISKINVFDLSIITSDYHIPRTHKIFSFVYGKKYLIKVKGIETNSKTINELLEMESLNQFYKTFEGLKSGDDDLIFQRLCSAHPYYNGTCYPRVNSNL